MHLPNYNQIACLSIVLLFCACSVSKKNNHQSARPNPALSDTLEALFLYEINVPSKCYTRFDQIEQERSLIFFDSRISSLQSIEKLYQKGVFFLSYQPVVNKFMEDHPGSYDQNRNSIQGFNNIIKPLIRMEDSSFNKSLYYDKDQIISYKKIYARIVVVELGNLTQLVPDTKKYKCCYSNRTERIKSYFITDILSFQLR